MASEERRNERRALLEAVASPAPPMVGPPVVAQSGITWLPHVLQHARDLVLEEIRAVLPAGDEQEAISAPICSPQHIYAAPICSSYMQPTAAHSTTCAHTAQSRALH
eukprot:1159459-Prymnesium_polylepis.1